MPCTIVYIGTPPAYPVLRYLWMAFYKNRCRNNFVSQIHTRFPYNTQLLPQSNDLLPGLDLDCQIVNRDDFFDCFHYDCCNVDVLSLSQCLVEHNDIRSPLLVFVLKVTASFRTAQCMMNTHDIYDGLASYDGHPS